ncbi:unnamed protein product, partial [Adineta ricciae]
VQKLARIFAAGDSDIESISSDEEVYLHQIIQQDDEPVDQIDPENTSSLWCAVSSCQTPRRSSYYWC